jgi:DNA-binding MarR family transcriptional regulator
MRVTYRTARVLAAIAGQPGLSNREIGQRAGVNDQGQISKLLARLARLELAENVRAGQANGLPHAWRLTPRGKELERTIAQDSGERSK